MEHQEYIAVAHLCTQYSVKEELFTNLKDTGLIKIITIEKRPCIHIDSIQTVEKIVRLHKDLNVNPEGIDVILNLLEKIDTLSAALNEHKNRLKLYEE